MAGIDYTIPGQFKGIQLESPMNQMAQAMQLRALQDTSQLNALKFQEAQREIQERNELAKLDPSSPQYLARLTRINPKLALDYQKAQFEADSAKTTQEKHKAELFQARLRQSRYFLEGLNANSPTAAQDYLGWVESQFKDPILGPVLAQHGVTIESSRARVAQAVNTGRLADLIAESKLGTEKFTELTPAFNKAENEQITQEHSDYLNTPGNPPLTRLQFIELRKRQRGTAAAPNAAAPAPAPVDAAASAPVTSDNVAFVSRSASDAAAPAPAAVDVSSLPLAERSMMFNRPQVNNQLGGFRTNAAAVNNLGGAPSFTTTAADKTAAATTTKTAGTTERPAIHPEAARLLRSNAPSDREAAQIIQRNYENDTKLTERERDFAAAVNAGFKGNYVQYQDQLRETEAEREYRRAKDEGSFKGSFLDWKRATAKATHIIVQSPSVSQGGKDLVATAILEGRLDPNRVNSRNIGIIAATLEKDPKANLKELSIDAASATASSKALATQSAKILTAANEADNMIKIVRNTSAKVDRTQYPTINAIQNAVDKGTGGKEIVKLNTAINALINSYARAINPTGVATVSDKNHAREIINSNYASGQLGAILDVMQEEMRVAKASPGEASQQLREQRNAPKAEAPKPYADPDKERRFQEYKKRQGANKP